MGNKMNYVAMEKKLSKDALKIKELEREVYNLGLSLDEETLQSKFWKDKAFALDEELESVRRAMAQLAICFRSSMQMILDSWQMDKNNQNG